MPGAADALCGLELQRKPTHWRSSNKSSVRSSTRCGRCRIAARSPTISRAGARRPQVVRPRGHRRRGQRRLRRRRRRAVLDPEHLQGVHADAGARQDRQPAVGAGRPRAFGKPVQFHRPARARAGHPAQSVHQRRRHRRHRRDPGGASAARGAGRDPALHAVPGRRPLRSSSTRPSPLRSCAPATAMRRSPTT